VQERKRWSIANESQDFDLENPRYSQDTFEPEGSESPGTSPAKLKEIINEAQPAELELLKQSLKNIPELMARELQTANMDPAERIIRKIKAMDQLGLEQLAKYIEDMESKQKLKPVMHKTRPYSSS
jgi:hypothetical protein